MTKQTESERLVAVFAERRAELDPANRFTYNKMWDQLAPYRLDDKYLLSDEQLREILYFARRGATLDERDRCVRVCEWNAENALSNITVDIYLSLADELEAAYEP